MKGWIVKQPLRITNCLIFQSVMHCSVNELTSLTSLAERPGLSLPDERVRAESAHC